MQRLDIDAQCQQLAEKTVARIPSTEDECRLCVGIELRSARQEEAENATLLRDCFAFDVYAVSQEAEEAAQMGQDIREPPEWESLIRNAEFRDALHKWLWSTYVLYACELTIMDCRLPGRRRQVKGWGDTLKRLAQLPTVATRTIQFNINRVFHEGVAFAILEEHLRGKIPLHVDFDNPKGVPHHHNREAALKQGETAHLPPQEALNLEIRSALRLLTGKEGRLPPIALLRRIHNLIAAAIDKMLGLDWQGRKEVTATECGTDLEKFVAANASDPAKTLLEREQLAQALKVLTSRQKQMFLLTLKGQTDSEIAARLHIAESTVRNTLADCRRKLQKALAQDTC